MPNIELVSLLIAAGAMGVSLALIYGVYKLLKTEQAKEVPRKSILIAIYVFMVFAVIMTPLAIYIEYQREKSDYNKLTERLTSLSAEQKYLVNLAGDPADPSFKMNDTTILLSRKLPADHFKNEERHFVLSPDKTKINIITSKNTALGYVLISELEESMHLEEIYALPDDLLYSGGARGGITDVLNFNLTENPNQAIKYLLKILRDTTSANIEPIQRLACKGICQEGILPYISLKDYDTLINFLNADIRNPPFKLWELAQVYYARAKKIGPKFPVKQKAYFNQHAFYLKEFVKSFDDYEKSYLRKAEKNRDSKKYNTLLQWRKLASGEP